MAREALAYGKPNLILLSVLDAEDATPGLTLENDPALAAADVSLISDEQSLTEMAAEHVAFTSGSEKPVPGQQISGATSGSTAIVIGTLLSSGTWGAGTAAGTLWVEQASGAFQAENLDNDDTGSLNVMTIGADLTDQAIDAVGRTIGIGVTSTEATCRQGNIEIRDATAVFLEEYIAFATYGHPDGEFTSSNPLILHSTTIETVVTQTDFDILTGPTDDGGIPAGTLAIITDATDTDQKTAVRVTSYDQSDNKRVQLTDTPAFTIAAGDRIDFLAVTPAIGLDGTNLTEAGGTGDHLTALAQASVATEARLAELDAANIPADIDTLLTRIVGTLASGTHQPQSGDAFAELTNARAEPGSVPAANADALAKLDWLYVLARNKLTNDGTTQTVRDDGDTADIATAAVAEVGGTVTRDEWA